MERACREAAGRPLQVAGCARWARRALVVVGAALLSACFGGGGGGGEEAAPPPSPPAITAQPQAVAVDDGQGASFNVTATGAGLSFQWQRNGTALAGGTAATLSLPAATLGDDGARFRVVVTNASGSVTSNEALLTVRAVAPRITAAPAAVATTAGRTASFSVTAGGSAPLAYQWLRDGTEIAGATAATHTTPVLTVADNGRQYAVRVSNAAGSVTSAAVVLTVDPAPVGPAISAQPVPATVGDGQTASFSVTATGSAPLSYQWQRNGSVISGATAASYTTPALGLADSGAAYRVVVSNAVGSVTSDAAVVTVTPAAPVAGRARLVFGSTHVVAVRADGSVIAWGGNTAGQLGGGAAIAGTNARQVATTALAVAAGQFESLALGADGLLRGWGRKFAGTTIIGGDAATSGTDQPTPATGGWPGGITHVVTGTGNAYGVALRSDGTVWHMPGVATAISGGLNQAARQVPGLSGIARLGAGVSGEPTAIGADGRVWRIAITALGAGSWQAAATEAPSVAGSVSAICNGFACMALDAAGAVRSFNTGGAASGVVGGLPVVRQLAATGSSFLAVGADGTLWRWNLGATPVQVTGLGSVVEAAGGLSSVLVRLADGSVWGYGPNSFGELGAGTPATTTPVQVPGINLN